MSTATETTVVDPFFELTGDGHWNACIGVQGDEQNYVEGYIEAAQELVSAILDKNLVSSRDTLAMPILYNARHGLELSLKFAINHLHAIGMLANPHKPDHDIVSHWRFLYDAHVGDTALLRLISDLEPFVVSLGSIDDDGQELRYATTREGKKSLEDRAIVNLLHVRDSLASMASSLTRLRDRILDIEVEHRTGSHTKECSRSDLVAIASMLGAHDTWRDTSFNDRKAAVRERFGLGSRKLSDAIRKIRNSRPLAAMVGLEAGTIFISNDKAVFALSAWIKVNPETPFDPSDLGTDYFNLDRERFVEALRASRDMVDTIAANLTDEEIVDLRTMFYIGRERVFGEHYEAMVADALDEFRHAALRWQNVHDTKGRQA